MYSRGKLTELFLTTNYNYLYAAKNVRPTSKTGTGFIMYGMIHNTKERWISQKFDAYIFQIIH